MAYKLSKQQLPKYLGLIMHAEYLMKISKFDEREVFFITRHTIVWIGYIGCCYFLLYFFVI